MEKVIEDQELQQKFEQRLTELTTKQVEAYVVKNRMFSVNIETHLEGIMQDILLENVIELNTVGVGGTLINYYANSDVFKAKHTELLQEYKSRKEVVKMDRIFLIKDSEGLTGLSHIYDGEDGLKATLYQDRLERFKDVEEFEENSKSFIHDGNDDIKESMEACLEFWLEPKDTKVELLEAKTFEIAIEAFKSSDLTMAFYDIKE